jgi:hypothetical protein
MTTNLGEGSLMAEQPVQQASGGSNPTSSLQSFRVAECPKSDVAAFIEEHHYSKNVAGVTASVCFRVDRDSQLVGAAIFGRPAMKETLDKYSEYGKLNLLELRRLCFINDTPRNTESRMLGVMLRSLANRGEDRVLSYADPNEGRSGKIYRAAGFRYLGQTAPITEICWQGRKWSTRNLNHYINDAKSLGLRKDALELRAALKSGEAVKVRGAGKFIFVKDLAAVHRPPIALVTLAADTPEPFTVLTLEALGARKNKYRSAILSIRELSISRNKLWLPVGRTERNHHTASDFPAAALVSPASDIFACQLPVVVPVGELAEFAVNVN